jgi:cobalt-zinc-cadmium efflux system membrane fusion protein
MNTKINNHYSIIFFLILLTILTPACNRSKQVSDTTNLAEVLPEDIVEMREDQISIADIETGMIETKTLNNTLNVNGIVAVSPQNFATVCAPLGGFVKSILMTPGNAVKKGETLAIIENQEFVDMQESFLEAKTRLEFAEAEFKRHTDLYNEDVYSQQNLQEVTANYKSLRAKVTALEQKLALIGIDYSLLTESNISRSVSMLSPIDGYIKDVNVNVGKFVAPADVSFEIINSENLILELTLFEKDAAKVKAGQKIKFFVNNETEEHEAIIYQTGKSIDSDRTCKVYASVITKCKNVLPGMYVNANIETSGERVTALPSDAVVSFDDLNYIFIFNKNKEEDGKPFTEYKIIEVQKGLTDGGYTQITLPEGFDINNTIIVIKGAYTLLSALKNAGEMAC